MIYDAIILLSDFVTVTYDDKIITSNNILA